VRRVFVFDFCGKLPGAELVASMAQVCQIGRHVVLMFLGQASELFFNLFQRHMADKSLHSVADKLKVEMHETRHPFSFPSVTSY
jgi:hypothetical protein